MPAAEYGDPEFALKEFLVTQFIRVGETSRIYATLGICLVRCHFFDLRAKLRPFQPTYGNQSGAAKAIPVASSLQVRAEVHLGKLTPQDVMVELYAGRVDMNGELVEGHAIAMRPEGQQRDGMVDYAVETSIARSGLHGVTVRVRPSHPDLPVSFLPGLICWADETKVPVTA